MQYSYVLSSLELVSLDKENVLCDIAILCNCLLATMLEMNTVIQNVVQYTGWEKVAPGFGDVRRG